MPGHLMSNEIGFFSADTTEAIHMLPRHLQEQWSEDMDRYVAVRMHMLQASASLCYE